jgi:hypothetical protein
MVSEHYITANTVIALTKTRTLTDPESLGMEILENNIIPKPSLSGVTKIVEI